MKLSQKCNNFKLNQYATEGIFATILLFFEFMLSWRFIFKVSRATLYSFENSRVLSYPRSIESTSKFNMNFSQTPLLPILFKVFCLKFPINYIGSSFLLPISSPKKSNQLIQYDKLVYKIQIFEQN